MGTPEELYRSPATAFVASFVGRANFLPARIVSVEGAAAVCEVAGGASGGPARGGAAGRERRG